MYLKSAGGVLFSSAPFRPAWAKGTDLWIDFVNNLGSVSSVVDTHVQTVYAPNAAGAHSSFAANVLTRTDLGLQTVPTRTNLCIRSQEFDNAAWTKNKCTITADQAIAPDGTTTAESLVEDNTTGVHYAVSTALTIAGTTTYTISVYAKEIGSRGIGLEVATTNFSNGANALFNRDGTDAVGTYGTGFTAISRSRSGVLANGYRLYQFQFQGPAGSVICFVYPMSGGDNNYAGDAASGLYIWQAQLELGAFASPAIPTTTATVTVTGNQQAVTSLTTQLATGVAGLVQVNVLGAAGISNPRIVVFSDGSAANRFAIFYNGTGFSFVSQVGGVVGTATVFATVGIGTYTIAFAASQSYQNARVVGQSAISALTENYASGMNRLGLGGNGFDTTNNIYAYTRKLALKFGAQDQASFDAMYAKALLAAAT